MVRTVHTTLLVPIFLIALCELIVSAPAENSVGNSISPGNSVPVNNLTENSTSAAGNSVVAESSNSVPSPSDSVPTTDNSVSVKDKTTSVVNPVPDKNDSVPVKKITGSDKTKLVATPGNSVPDKGNSAPVKKVTVPDSTKPVSSSDNSDLDKGNSAPDETKDESKSVVDKTKTLTTAGNSVSTNNDLEASPSDNIAVSGKSLAGNSSISAVDNNTSTGPIDYYKTKYDHVDIEALLNNRRMVNYYSKCMLNQAPCPPDGAEFKRILPDAIRTNCRRCTEKQKSVTIRAVKRLMKEYPKIWAQLANAWDPDDIFVKKFLVTYNNWEYHPPPTQKPIVFDRFGDDDDPNNQNSPSSDPNNILYNIPPLPTIPPRILNRVEPFANGIGAGFTATVSVGNKIVGDVLRGIGAVGNRVVETGAQIADVVVKSLTRPL